MRVTWRLESLPLEWRTGLVEVPSEILIRSAVLCLAEEDVWVALLAWSIESRVRVGAPFVGEVPRRGRMGLMEP